MMKNYKFENRIRTTVATADLIEDYHMLREAIRDTDWNLVKTVMDCIAEQIRDHTTVPEGCNIQPSESSLIAPCRERGIILRANGEDPRCYNGTRISKVMSGGVCQCSNACLRTNKCKPEAGTIRLCNGFYHTADIDAQIDLLANLESICK